PTNLGTLGRLAVPADDPTRIEGEHAGETARPKQRRHGRLPRRTTVLAVTHTPERPGWLAGSGVGDRFLERGDEFLVGLGADVLLIAHHMVVEPSLFTVLHSCGFGAADSLTSWLADSARVVVGRKLCFSSGQGAQHAHELRDGGADFVGAVLLDEVQSADGGLGEVGPRADEVADAAPDDGPWFGVDEQFGHLAFGQPAVVVVDHRGDVGGFAVDGDVAWPGQRRPAGLARFDERLPVVVHFFVAELARHSCGQNLFDEPVLLQHHGLALRRSKALKHAAEIRGELRPADWGDAGFHERDALDAVTMLVGPIEAEY